MHVLIHVHVQVDSTVGELQKTGANASEFLQEHVKLPEMPEITAIQMPTVHLPSMNQLNMPALGGKEGAGAGVLAGGQHQKAAQNDTSNREGLWAMFVPSPPPPPPQEGGFLQMKLPDFAVFPAK